MQDARHGVLRDQEHELLTGGRQTNDLWLNPLGSHKVRTDQRW
ncbi:hypothetical protein SERN_1195 [Serinibacter arcticus]|uniref:Uncharacterized protein n=1 Tax=Serinibacter arcticus TaxID=1655435 RepID=A0A4Z1E6I1_9MICO|nr:hypothetical protein SERN_1195 [Serinibacter arcticus]